MASFVEHGMTQSTGPGGRRSGGRSVGGDGDGVAGETTRDLWVVVKAQVVVQSQIYVKLLERLEWGWSASDHQVYQQ